jgi:hypothetical protein
LQPWPRPPASCHRPRHHGDLPANQIGRQRRQPVKLIVGPAIFDRYGLALDIAGIFEAPAKSAQTVREPVGRLAVEESDHRHRSLLCACGHWPRGRRAAEQRDELAPSDDHLIPPAERSRSNDNTPELYGSAAQTFTPSNRILLKILRKRFVF